MLQRLGTKVILRETKYKQMNCSRTPVANLPKIKSEIGRRAKGKTQRIQTILIKNLCDIQVTYTPRACARGIPLLSLNHFGRIYVFSKLFLCTKSKRKGRILERQSFSMSFLCNYRCIFVPDERGKGRYKHKRFFPCTLAIFPHWL